MSMSDTQKESHKRGTDMYNAGITCGIRFVIDIFFSRFDSQTREQLINFLIEEYHE